MEPLYENHLDQPKAFFQHAKQCRSVFRAVDAAAETDAAIISTHAKLNFYLPTLTGRRVERVYETLCFNRR